MKPDSTLVKRIAGPVFDMPDSTAASYVPPLREAFGLGLYEYIAATRTIGLMSREPRRCVSFVRAQEALRYESCDESCIREGFAGDSPIEVLAALLRQDPATIIKDGVEFVILTNPLEAQIRASMQDVQIVAARFVSPADMPARSALRGAKILQPSGLAHIARVVQQLQQHEAGRTPFGFESRAMQ